MDGPSLSLPFLNLALEQWGQATLLGPGLLSLWGKEKVSGTIPNLKSSTISNPPSNNFG
jgi:hypothetical protein